MSTQLVPARLPLPAPAVAAYGLSPEKWRVLTDAIFPSARTTEAVLLALDYCRVRGYDPFRRPVNIVPMWNAQLGREVETVWPGINGIQADAAKSGSWAGMDPPKWGPDRTETFSGRVKRKDGWHEVEVTVTFPEWCEVTVYRLVAGHRCAFAEPVYWLETYGRVSGSEVPNDMWARRARGQLLKCSKAASLRAAFPELADYAGEEMEGKTIQGGGFVIEGKAEPQPEPAPRPEPVPTLPKLAVLDEFGQVLGESSDPRELLELYERAVREAEDPALASKANLDLLLILEETARSPKRKAWLQREIETAQAVRVVGPEDEPALAAEAGEAA